MIWRRSSMSSENTERGSCSCSKWSVVHVGHGNMWSQNRGRSCHSAAIPCQAALQLLATTTPDLVGCGAAISACEKGTRWRQASKGCFVAGVVIMKQWWKCAHTNQKHLLSVVQCFFVWRLAMSLSLTSVRLVGWPTFTICHPQIRRTVEWLQVLPIGPKIHHPNLGLEAFRDHFSIFTCQPKGLFHLFHFIFYSSTFGERSMFASTAPFGASPKRRPYTSWSCDKSCEAKKTMRGERRKDETKTKRIQEGLVLALFFLAYPKNSPNNADL